MILYFAFRIFFPFIEKKSNWSELFVGGLFHGIGLGGENLERQSWAVTGCSTNEEEEEEKKIQVIEE